MIRKLVKAIVCIALVLIIGCFGIFALSEANLGFVSDWASSARSGLIGILNGGDEAQVLREKADKLLDKAIDQAGKAGTVVKDAAAKAALEELQKSGIAGWKAIDLPATAVKSHEIDGSQYGFDVTITLYADSSYITLTSNDGDVTLQVPEKRRNAIKYLYVL